MITKTLISGLLSCVISATGIQSISLSEKQLTMPPSPGFPAQGLYDSSAFPPGTPIGPAVTSTIDVHPDYADVQTTYRDVTDTTTYKLDGQDIDLSILIQNTGNQPINNFSIALPTFDLGHATTGNLKSWDPSLLLTQPTGFLHPGWWSPLAVSYARSDGWGVAFHCKSHFDKPSLFNAWAKSSTNGLPPPVADMSLFVADSVAPRNSVTIDVTIHLTQTPNVLTSLLASYLRDFHAFAGPMQYTGGDNRAWIQFAAADSGHITPSNPLGFNGVSRRFDLPNGVLGFEDMIWPLVGTAQGVMFWQPQGINPRGANSFRPDFDAWPDSVKANLPKLFAWCKANGLKSGLCAEAEDMVTTLDWTTDQRVKRDARNETQMAELIKRFDNAAAYGANSYYLDDMGYNLNSYRIMQQVRSHLGPKVPTFSEFTSDLMLSVSGVYAELNPTAEDGKSPPDGNTRWYSSEDLQVMHLLYPNMGLMLARINGNKTTVAPLVTPAQIAQWKAAPLIEDFQSRAFLPYLTRLKEYQSGPTPIAR